MTVIVSFGACGSKGFLMVKGFTSWSQCTVPMHALLLRDRYADGPPEPWALMTTASFTDPRPPTDHYDWRAKIEEGYRLLECFYDLSKFHSPDFNVIAAQVVFPFHRRPQAGPSTVTSV